MPFFFFADLQHLDVVFESTEPHFKRLTFLYIRALASRCPILAVKAVDKTNMAAWSWKAVCC